MIKTLLASILLALPAFASCMPVLFDLRTLVTSSNDDVVSLSLTQQGVTATLSANTGLIHRTNSAVGINSAGGCDNSDELDSACPGVPSERLTVTFDRPVELLDFNVSGLSGGDAGVLAISSDNNNGASSLSFAFNRSGTFAPSLGVPLVISSGQAFYIASVADNTSASGKGFSFNRFTVQAITSSEVAVPEPGALLLILTGLTLLVRFRQQQLTVGRLIV